MSAATGFCVRLRSRSLATGFTVLENRLSSWIIWIGLVLLLLAAAFCSQSFCHSLFQSDRWRLTWCFIHFSIQNGGSVVENDRVRPRPVERQPFSLSKPCIDPIHSILMYFPGLIVSRSARLGHVVEMHCHKIHGCKAYRLSLLAGKIFSRYQSCGGDGVQVDRLSNVKDVLEETVGNQHIVLQKWINRIFS